MANHLYCGAKVVGGHQEALTFLEKNKDDFNIRKIKRNAFLLLHAQCCKAGAEIRGAEIKWPPGAGAEITNCRNSDLQLRGVGAGAERNDFGSITPLLTP